MTPCNIVKKMIIWTLAHSHPPIEKRGFSKSLTSLKFDWPSNQINYEFTTTGIGISTFKRVRITYWPILTRMSWLSVIKKQKSENLHFDPFPSSCWKKKGFSKSLIRLYNSLTSLNFDWPSNQTKHEFTPTGIDRFSPFCTWNTYSSWIWTPEIPVPGGCVYSHCVGNEISELNSYIKFIRYYLKLEYHDSL